MSIRLAIVTLLSHGSAYGLFLHAELEERLDRRGTINAGQVYSTIDRLIDARLVEQAGTTADDLPLYTATPAGRAEAASWLAAPCLRRTPDWTEMTDQVALAVTLPGYRPDRLIAAYREAWAHSVTPMDPDDIASSARTALARAAIGWLDEIASRHPERDRVRLPFLDERRRRGRPARQSLVDSESAH